MSTDDAFAMNAVQRIAEIWQVDKARSEWSPDGFVWWPGDYRVRVCAIAAVTAATISLAGCVNSQQTYTADGQQGHVINCTPAWTGGIVGQVASASTSWGTCYQKAGEICGAAGYDIIQQVGEGGVYGQGGQGGGFVSSTNNRTLIVKCKGQGTLAASASAK